MIKLDIMNQKYLQKSDKLKIILISKRSYMNLLEIKKINIYICKFNTKVIKCSINF
jgi:hypothetical protein